MTKPLLATTNPLEKHHQSSVVAACQSCPARWDSRNALATAAIHARSHGHRVIAHAATTITYDGGAKP